MFGEYKTLAVNEQTLSLLSESTFIDQYFDGTFYILLFQLKDFYIEVFYHTERDEIYGIRSFNATDQLEPYFKNIDLSDLAGC